MGVCIIGSVGAEGDNKPEDIRKIQTLLNTVWAKPSPAITGKNDNVTESAILNFQRLWETPKPDGRVDPQPGMTLRRLNQTATPLKLLECKVKGIRYGGYWIKYSGFVPPAPHKVMLYLPPTNEFRIPDDAVDITGCPSDNVIMKYKEINTIDKLPEVLRLIIKNKLWGKEAQACVYLVRDSNVVSKSNVLQFPCPVMPYSGPLRPELGEGDEGPKLRYTGRGTGRMLYIPVIDGKYYFAYGGNFVTDDLKRGFDCTTYVGAVFGVDSRTGAMSGYGTQLANHLDA